MLKLLFFLLKLEFLKERVWSPVFSASVPTFSMFSQGFQGSSQGFTVGGQVHFKGGCLKRCLWREIALSTSKN